MQWVASTLHTTSEHGVSSITTADAHTSAASSRLNWRPPADLNGLVRFAERRNLVSACVSSRFKMLYNYMFRRLTMTIFRLYICDTEQTNCTGLTWLIKFSEYNSKWNIWMNQLFYTNHILYNIARCIYIYLDKHMCTYNLYTHNMITILA